MQQILVQIKNVYGNDTIYPVCESAQTFAKMVGQKSLTASNIKYIKDLGYTVKVMQQQPATL